jgi:hypothetical protein
VNPAPLKVVESRAGEPAPQPIMMLAVKRGTQYRNGTLMRRVSVHREGCLRIPAQDSTGWSVTAASHKSISGVLDEADRADVPTAVSCSTCGGWSVLS